MNTLSADRAGDVLVHFCGSILKYDGATGKLLAQFNGDNNSPSDFYMDEMLFPDDGLLELASGSSNANEILLHLDASGRVLARYPNPVTDQSPRQPANAITIQPAMDGLGNIFY